MMARGTLLAVAGQIGWDETETLVSPEFLPQFARALNNVVAVVRAAGGEPAHLISLTIYVTNKAEYTADLRAIGQTYRNVIGRHYPTMALVEVADLLEPGAKVEVQALAVVPDAA